jgi:hypothetical protein
METSNECSKTLRKHIEDAYNEVLIQTPRRRRNTCYSPDITGYAVQAPLQRDRLQPVVKFITTLLAVEAPMQIDRLQPMVKVVTTLLA